MTMKELFETLGAPLNNFRWSWGAVRERDGVVFLRVWQHQVRMHNGSRLVELTRGDAPLKLGRRERLKHIDLIHNGARCYLIMCVAENPSATPRSVRSFNAREVFLGGRLRQVDANLYIERRNGFPIEEV
jgi:hypothetical protein